MSLSSSIVTSKIMTESSEIVPFLPFRIHSNLGKRKSETLMIEEEEEINNKKKIDQSSKTKATSSHESVPQNEKQDFSNEYMFSSPQTPISSPKKNDESIANIIFSPLCSTSSSSTNNFQTPYSTKFLSMTPPATPRKKLTSIRSYSVKSVQDDHICSILNFDLFV
eukprot:c2061_g1_i1.p1 GENE.c2061_g1_i1~~c2061_g1_i1.p1  ORF type:complete len:166 (+),score=44.12 c2061_g1_i1:65-562(+)